jgi:hypothetical protein
VKAFRALAVLLALVALPRSPAWACSCITAPAGTYLARAAAAFTGEARAVQPQGGGVVVATFRVARVYKGSIEQDVSVFTGAGADNCGIAFTAKRTYTVFASSKAGALVTGLCDGTAEGDTLAASRPLREYAPLTETSPAAPAPQPVAQMPVASTRPASSRTVPIAGAAFLACAVAVSVLRRSSAV